MSSSIKPPLDLNVLFRIYNPGITAFYFRFRNVHAFAWTRARALDQPLQPLETFILNRYVVREEVPLWWSCITTREPGHSDRVVRSWLARRTRNAFKESLRKKGFDTHGRPLPESGNKANIFGTANISVKRGAAKISYAELVKQTDVAVTQMQRILKKEQGKPNKFLGEPTVGRKRWQSNKPVSRVLRETQ